MRKFTAFTIFFCLLCASTPAIAHAIGHAVVSHSGHSHDGGATSHLHHDEAGHSSVFSVLPPGLSRRNTVAAPGTGTALILFCPVPPSAAGSLFVPAAPLDIGFVKLFSSGVIPQIASIPPPFPVS